MCSCRECEHIDKCTDENLCYEDGLRQNREDMVDKLLSICGSYPNHNDCLECSFAIWVDNEWNGCAIEQLKEQK